MSSQACDELSLRSHVELFEDRGKMISICSGADEEFAGYRWNTVTLAEQYQDFALFG